MAENLENSARSKSAPSEDDYALKSTYGAPFPAPELAYEPPKPRNYAPKIGVIGCGGIIPFHLRAYQKQGFRVAALCNRTLEKAQKARDEFFPDARIFADAEAIFADESIEVVDITTHPDDRVALIARALECGKHVLSQKPFVIDLGEGEELVALAQKKGRRLAVNQNGRFSPHFSYARRALEAALIGELVSTHFRVHWNHGWIQNTPFEQMPGIILYDFAIHWFDLTAQFWGENRAKRVFATRAHAPSQTLRPPMLSQALVEFETGQASLVFDAILPFGARDTSYFGGTQGSILCDGPDLNAQTVTIFNENGHASPRLNGDWFSSGFEGAMGELLCAIEENREPLNSAKSNLRSLELSFAAIESSLSGVPVEVGSVRRVPQGALRF